MKKMKNGIQQPKLNSVAEFLKADCRYNVPKYQRSFAWGQDQINDFWEDLIAAMQRDTAYFLGTLVVQNTEDKTAEIIDGQQRLTCISMVFSAIRSAFLASNDPDRAERVEMAYLGSKGFKKSASVEPKLTLNDTNHPIYEEFVLGKKTLDEVNDALVKRKKTLAKTNKDLLNAYAFFLNKVGDETKNRGAKVDEEFLVPMLECLGSAVKVIAIWVTTEEDANLFFESLNARGKELAVSDLVKNRIYVEAGPQVEQAQKLWERMEKELGGDGIPEFLRHYWIAKKASGLVREKDLYRFVAADIRGKQSKTIQLVKDLADSAEDYAMISDPEAWPDDSAYDASFEATLEDLKLFRVTQCHPILLNVIQKIRTPKEVAKAFKAVANFSFRYFVIGNQSPGNLERASSQIAEDIRKGKIKKASELAEQLKKDSPDAEFRSSFGNAELKKSQAKLARYILLRIEDSLAAISNPTAAKVANRDPKTVNLEHVLPQSPTTAWTLGFSSGVDPEPFVNRIGNLTLLHSKVNGQIGNKDFLSKKNSALSKSDLHLNEHFKKISSWSDKQIITRQAEMADHAIKIWSL